MTPAALATALAVGRRISIPYRDTFSPERALSLESYRPVNHTLETPVVIVQHGQSRNGREYCDAWIPVADQAGLLVVGITFPQETWPDALTGMVPELGPTPSPLLRLSRVRHQKPFGYSSRAAST